VLGALSEDYACLCLPGQPFHETSLPPVSCIEHAEMPCCDLVIIERFLCSLPVLLLRGCLAFVPGGDVRLNRIVQQISASEMFSKHP
jgi:hypothetical protein